MTIASFALILVGVLLNAAAQLMLKAGTNVVGVVGVGQGTWTSQILAVILQPFIIGGLACYAFSVAIWIAALSRVPVSVAYPMLSIGYVVNAIAAHFLFGEALSAARVGGISVIIVGVWIVSRS